jgi:DNA-binding NarL/FixJ family response regulator
MRLANIAIIEKSPLGSSTIEAVLKAADFNIVINTETINYFLNKAKENSIDVPDVCLLDRTMEPSLIHKIRQHYPKIKIVVYDTIANPPDAEVLHTDNFDAYIPNSVKLEHWAAMLQSIINISHPGR